MPRPESLILYERDDEGVPFAIEEVRAIRWDVALATVPDPTVADVRIVHLERGPLPPALPAWLSVDLAGRGIAEPTASYVLDRVADAAPARIAHRLWASSLHHRRTTSTLDDFLRAGATALRHPELPPVDAGRQAEALRAFARGRTDLAPLVELRALALERWLHVTFVEPEAFADAILLARVEAIAPGDAELLRFVRAAIVPAKPTEHADLAIDRVVLLEQASTWRYVEDAREDGSPIAAALASARQWQRRYQRAYAAHYRRTIDECDDVLRDAEESMARLSALERLNLIHALGEPEGTSAIVGARAAVAALLGIPCEADPQAATTAGITLGAPHPDVARFRAAAAEVGCALQARLRRLAASLAGCALGHDDNLTAIRHAIALSEVDHLDRVLDERLAARIDALLAGTPRSPLALVAQQFPEVTLTNLEAAVEEFRRAAVHAIEQSPDGRTSLGGGVEHAPFEYAAAD